MHLEGMWGGTRVSYLPNPSLLAFCCCDKDHGLTQLVEDGAYSSYTSGSQHTTERNRGRNSRQDLGAEKLDKNYSLAHSQADIAQD